jgi:hypothetical protein
LTISTPLAPVFIGRELLEPGYASGKAGGGSHKKRSTYLENIFLSLKNSEKYSHIYNGNVGMRTKYET